MAEWVKAHSQHTTIMEHNPKFEDIGHTMCHLLQVLLKEGLTDIPAFFMEDGTY